MTIHSKIILTTAIVAFGITGQAQAANLNITLDGIQNTDGKIAVGVFDEAENFPEEEFRLTGTFLDPHQADSSGMITFKIKDLIPGTYAVVIYQDANDNGELDKSFFGIPQEMLAFSNGVKATFGPPEFDEAAFQITEEETHI